MCTKAFIEMYVKEWVGDKPEHQPTEPEMEAAVDMVQYCMRRARGEAASSVLFFREDQQGSEASWKERMDECEGGLRGPIPSDSTRAKVEQWMEEGNTLETSASSFRAARRRWRSDERWMNGACMDR